MARWIGPGPQHAHISDLLGAAEVWRDTCLLEAGSLVTDASLWTPETMADLTARLEVDPLEGEKASFYAKLERQLQGARREVVQLATEVLWLAQLFVWNEDWDRRAGFRRARGRVKGATDVLDEDLIANAKGDDGNRASVAGTPMTRSALSGRIARKHPGFVDRDVEVAVKMMLDRRAVLPRSPLDGVPQRPRRATPRRDDAPPGQPHQGLRAPGGRRRALVLRQGDSVGDARHKSTPVGLDLRRRATDLRRLDLLRRDETHVG